MERSKVDLTYDIVAALNRNYPYWPSTFGKCFNADDDDHKGHDSARGSGECPICLEKDLANIVGDKLAYNMHHGIKQRASAWYAIKQHLDNENDS